MKISNFFIILVATVEPWANIATEHGSTLIRSYVFILPCIKGCSHVNSFAECWLPWTTSTLILGNASFVDFPWSLEPCLLDSRDRANAAIPEPFSHHPDRQTIRTKALSGFCRQILAFLFPFPSCVTHFYSPASAAVVSIWRLTQSDVSSMLPVPRCVVVICPKCFDSKSFQTMLFFILKWGRARNVNGREMRKWSLQTSSKRKNGKIGDENDADMMKLTLFTFLMRRRRRCWGALTTFSLADSGRRSYYDCLR